VRKIENTATRSFGPFQNVPVTPIVIDKAVLLEKKKK
jgi:hypothetical protein